MTTSHDARAFIDRAKNARAVILDLRENGGGRTDSLEEIAGHLFDERAKLADFIGRDKTVPVEVKSRAPHITAALVVLVDSHSASASEMLARYVQIRHRGKVIGDRTSARVNAARIFPGEVGSVYRSASALQARALVSQAGRHRQSGTPRSSSQLRLPLP